MRDLTIVIPSHKRAGGVTTVPKVLDPDVAIVCVPDSQVDEYKDKQPYLDVVGHPDSIIGLMAKRQWIYEKYGDVFFIDDDAKSMFHFEHSKQACKIDPKMTFDLIQRLAGDAKELGVFLFGFSPYADPRNYIPQRPFGVTGLCKGGAFGLFKDSGLFFNANIVAGGDYWLSALNAYLNRMCLIDYRYGFDFGDTFGAVGGQGSRRTLETEAADTKLLRRSFGSDVIAKKQNKPLSPTKMGHEHQRTLKLPF